MNPRNWAPSALLVLSLLVGAGAIATHARQDPHGAGQAPLTGASFATVDMQRVYEASEAPALEGQKQRQLFQEIVRKMERIQATPYLTPEELIETLQILTAAAPTPVQEARAKALAALSAQREQELTQLGTKKETELTAADKRRIQALQQMGRDLQDRLPTVQNGMQTDARADLDTFRRDQTRKLWDLVGKVAASHRILNVWDRSSLVYSVNDLTPELLRKVGAHAAK